jgi:hypothetical protein
VVGPSLAEVESTRKKEAHVAKQAAAKGTRSGMATSAKKGLVVRSAEGRRLSGLKKLPAKQRGAAVSKFLASAK